MNSHPSWKRPLGVSVSVADCLNDPQMAEDYDQNISGNIVTSIDLPKALAFFRGCHRVCDLGCGTGRLCRALAHQGMEVLGVDLSLAMLRVAARNCAEVNSKICLIRANLVELDAIRDEMFDGAACLFSTLGMIHGAEERLLALRHVYRILKPGGGFLVHVHNLWYHLWSKAGRGWLIRDRWRAFLGDESAGTCDLPQRLGRVAPALHHFRSGELLRLLKSAGFTVLFVEPLAVKGDGRLRLPWLFSGLRSYGFFAGAVRPS